MAGEVTPELIYEILKNLQEGQHRLEAQMREMNAQLIAMRTHMQGMHRHRQPLHHPSTGSTFDLNGSSVALA